MRIRRVQRWVELRHVWMAAAAVRSGGGAYLAATRPLSPAAAISCPCATAGNSGFSPASTWVGSLHMSPLTGCRSGGRVDGVFLH